MKTKLKLKNNTGLVLLGLIAIGVIVFAYYYFNVIEGADFNSSQLSNVIAELQQGIAKIQQLPLPTCPPPPPPQQQQQQNLNFRIGSFSKLCDNIVYNNGTLTATCKNRWNQDNNTSINNITLNDLGNININDGNLTR